MNNLIEKICSINFNNLDKSLESFTFISMMIIEKHNQMFKMLLSLKKDYEIKQSELFSTLKSEMLNGKMTITEMKLWVEKDKSLIEMKYKMEYMKAEITTLEKHLDNIKSARWDCKALIEYHKIKSGII